MQAEAPLQLGVKLIVRQRDDAGRLGIGLGPHQRGAVAGERQDRERARGQEMLHGAALVRTLMRHRGDDRRLAVIPAVRRNAGLLAHARVRAVRRDQQRGADIAIAERHR